MTWRTALNNQDQLEQTHICKEDPCGTNCYAQEHIKMIFLIILNQCSLFSATLTSKMHLTESKEWSSASSRWKFDLSHKQKVISDWFTFMWKWLVLNNHFLVHLSEHFPRESTEHGWVLGQDNNLQRGEWCSLLIQPWEVLESKGLEVDTAKPIHNHRN